MYKENIFSNNTDISIWDRKEEKIQWQMFFHIVMICMVLGQLPPTLKLTLTLTQTVTLTGGQLSRYDLYKKRKKYDVIK